MTIVMNCKLQGSVKQQSIEMLVRNIVKLEGRKRKFNKRNNESNNAILY